MSKSNIIPGWSHLERWDQKGEGCRETALRTLPNKGQVYDSTVRYSPFLSVFKRLSVEALGHMWEKRLFIVAPRREAQ
jgi:hypothetical protein